MELQIVSHLSCIFQRIPRNVDFLMKKGVVLCYLWGVSVFQTYLNTNPPVFHENVSQPL